MTVPAMYVFCTLSDIHENKDRFSTHAGVHSYDTRGKNSLISERHKYFITEKNSLDIQMYNSLNPTWRSYNLVTFRKYLRRNLSQSPIYTVAEFAAPVSP